MLVFIVSVFKAAVCDEVNTVGHLLATTWYERIHNTTAGIAVRRAGQLRRGHVD